VIGDVADRGGSSRDGPVRVADGDDGVVVVAHAGRAVDRSRTVRGQTCLHRTPPLGVVFSLVVTQEPELTGCLAHDIAELEAESFQRGGAGVQVATVQVVEVHVARRRAQDRIE